MCRSRRGPRPRGEGRSRGRGSIKRAGFLPANRSSTRSSRSSTRSLPAFPSETGRRSFSATSKGLPVRKPRSRLHRARIKLKGRLARRGLVAGAVLKTAMLAASPPQALADSTVKAAIAFAANPAALGAISASVFALTREVLTSMMLTKMKTATVVLVALGLVGTGAGVVAQDPTPTRSAKDDDRLQQVEQKLDRVLQALEGRQAPTAAPPSQVGMSLLGAGQGSLSQGAGSDPKQTPTRMEVRWGSSGSSPLFQMGMTPASAEANPGGRLDRAERRLDDIEKRLMRLEQKVGIMSGDIRPTEATAPLPATTAAPADPTARQ